MEVLRQRVEQIQSTIRRAAEQSGRRYEDISLVAATKTQPVQLINQAIAYGIRIIGENRVQELLDKYDEYEKEQVSVHFIGHLQVNKVKYIIDKVDMIQSVDSIRLAAEIERQCRRVNRLMEVLVEINLGREESKSGIYIEQLEPFLEELQQFEHLRVRGLMAIPPICKSMEDARYNFSSLYKVFLDISRKKLDNSCMDFLSMGMSNDYACAIECGANMVRVGTALFGSRKK